MMYALPLLLFTFGTASGCRCTGVNTGVDTARYGSSYGTTCSAWEDGGTFTSAPSQHLYGHRHMVLPLVVLRRSIDVQ